MSLSGKVVLVTGGTKGIGKAIAEMFAAEGASIALTYGSDDAAAKEIVTKLGESQALAIKADARKLDSIDLVVKETVSKFGKIDILIPCAGYMPMIPLEKLTEELFEQQNMMNVKSPLFLVQKSLPHMGPGSRIILISTNLTWAQNITEGYLVYLMNKGSIEQMGRILSKSLAPKEIFVNILSPGPTATELFLRGKSEQILDHIKSLSPLNRLAEPEDIAEAALFLANPKNKWVIGQNLRVNGAGSV